MINKKTKDQLLLIFGGALIILFGGCIFGEVLNAIMPHGVSAIRFEKSSPASAAPNYGFDRFEEYDAAKHFIQAQYPGAQSFSGCDDSTVQAGTDGTCVVAIAVGGVNAFNAPLRDTLTVIMKFQDGRFGLQRIDSQNEAALVQQQIRDGN